MLQTSSMSNYEKPLFHISTLAISRNALTASLYSMGLAWARPRLSTLMRRRSSSGPRGGHGARRSAAHRLVTIETRSVSVRRVARCSPSSRSGRARGCWHRKGGPTKHAPAASFQRHREPGTRARKDAKIFFGLAAYCRNPALAKQVGNIMRASLQEAKKWTRQFLANGRSC
jgi:hypothetical protein